MDRNQLLEQTDLQVLVMEVCGPPQGRGRGARWQCPNPDHPDVHPSMGIYERGRGQRWKCHACGAGGTAIDLLMIVDGIGAGEAMEALATRTGMVGRRPPTPFASAPRASRPSQPDPPGPRALPSVGSTAMIEQFVAITERLLWEPAATMAGRFLQERGFAESLLRINRVGFDPGPAAVPRASGLPRRSPGVVFPVLDPDSGLAIYYQVRALSPRAAAQRKYDQPVSDVAPNPKLATIRTVAEPVSEMLAITEGIPDGLTAAQAGMRSVAVLGVAHAGADSAEGLARLILEHHPAPAYAVCFDPDMAGTGAGNRLADRLANQGATVALVYPPKGHADLNAWLQADSQGLTRQLTGTSAFLSASL